MKQATATLKDCPGALKAGQCQTYGPVTRLRRPTRVHALGPGAISQILDDPSGHATGDPECMNQLPL